MSTFDITVPAGSGVGAGGAAASAFTEPGDFDGATVDDVSVVGTPTITSDGTTDDTIGIRWRIQTDGGVAIWGDYGSDAVSAASASLGSLVSSNTITDGSAPSPAPSTAVAADWDEIAYNANYFANMKDDAETCSWSAFTIRVTYTLTSADVTLTADPGALALAPSTATALVVGLTAVAGSLLFTGAEADLIQEAVLDAQPSQLTLTGAEADLLADLSLTGDPGSLLFTGADATLFVGVSLDAQPGVLTLTGADAALDQALSSDLGALLFTGAEANLNVALSSDPGVLLFTGAMASLVEGGDVSLTADPGALLLTGATVNFNVALSGDPGALTLIGSDAALYTGATVSNNRVKSVTFKLSVPSMQFSMSPAPQIKFSLSSPSMKIQAGPDFLSRLLKEDGFILLKEDGNALLKEQE